MIDRRYRSGRPLIVTTNLPLKKLKEEVALEKKRIYDRILKMCIPMYVSGDSKRGKNANSKMDRMKELLQTDEGRHDVNE